MHMATDGQPEWNQNLRLMCVNEMVLERWSLSLLALTYNQTPPSVPHPSPFRCSASRYHHSRTVKIPGLHFSKDICGRYGLYGQGIILCRQHLAPFLGHKTPECITDRLIINYQDPGFHTFLLERSIGDSGPGISHFQKAFSANLSFR